MYSLRIKGSRIARTAVRRTAGRNITCCSFLLFSTRRSTLSRVRVLGKPEC